jgi:tRNA A-37 threonylcarbamoyl transferase component Bud32
MTNDRLERILVGALDRAGDDRRAFLDDACGPDGALRSRVLELIEAHEGEPGVLEPVDPVDDEEADRLIGRRVGSFTIDRLLAVGGMGSVYVATQDDPHREVALKLIRSGIASRSALRRFRLEAQVLGRLHHPNIAQIFEAGSLDDGNGSVPYFAMEYVPDAEPITQYVGSRRLGTRDRLALLSKVCDAVHHGHQKGVIHRDLKPGNILVDASGNVKVIDFGVARATDSDIAVTTMGTDVGRLMGTLAYMSPEQCAADPDDLDTRSDVYSVGVVLYELVCGRLPYDLQRVPFPEAARVIREEMPTKPSTVDRTLRGDVETIALKALEKDRGRRYQSAADLGRDIDRYLRGEAVEARRPSTTYRLHTFARRHKVAATVLIALLLAVPALTAATVIAARSAERARDEQQRAETALAEAQTIIDFVTESLMATGGAKDLRVVEAMERAIELLDAGDLAGQFFGATGRWTRRRTRRRGHWRSRERCVPATATRSLIGCTRWPATWIARGGTTRRWRHGRSAWRSASGYRPVMTLAWRPPCTTSHTAWSGLAGSTRGSPWNGRSRRPSDACCVTETAARSATRSGR